MLGETALPVTGCSQSYSPCSVPLHPRLFPTPDFVELPAAFNDLRYSNILCGVIRGALEMVSLRVTCAFVKDVLCGDDVTEIRVSLQEVLAEGTGAAYQDE